MTKKRRRVARSPESTKPRSSPAPERQRSRDAIGGDEDELDEDIDRREDDEDELDEDRDAERDDDVGDVADGDDDRDRDEDADEDEDEDRDEEDEEDDDARRRRAWRNSLLLIAGGVIVVIILVVMTRPPPKPPAPMPETANITLVTADRTDLDCMAAEGVGSYQCGFKDEKTPRTGVDERNKLRPYMTLDQQRYLIPGLFLEPAIEARFKSEAPDKPRDQLKRFTAKCKLKSAGTLNGVQVRWTPQTPWQPPANDVPVVTISGCTIEG